MLVAAEQCFFEGNRHLAARDYASAQACYRQAVSIAPRFAEAHANLGWLLTEIDACDEADACYRRALAIDPSQVQISLNYGALLARLKRFGEAEAIYLRAVELAPQSAHTWSNLGVLYAQMARFKESEACCRRSMLLDPNYAKARINLSYLCLRQGRFEEGWEHYESRSWRCALETHVDCPRWAGESLEGCSLLVGNEGGFGDMIQFSRYAAVLKRQGARRITLVSPPALQALFASLDGADEVLSCDEPISSSGWDFWTPLMSAPYHCGTRMGSIPAGLPYLRADSRAVARWRPSLPEQGALVGLVWRGNPKFENDDERSIPSIDWLEPFRSVRGAAFVSLQKGPGEAEASRAGPGSHFVHLGGEVESFADTAAVLQSLDLVICVDTAVAHLAGAMGKPVWVLLPHHMTDWRWLTERTDSPWYPGVMRLFRRSVRADWSAVIAEVRLALDQFVRARVASS